MYELEGEGYILSLCLILILIWSESIDDLPPKMFFTSPILLIYNEPFNMFRICSVSKCKCY